MQWIKREPHLRGGMLYTVPSKSPNAYKPLMRGPKFMVTIARPRTDRAMIEAQATPTDISPEDGMQEFK
jgi:hypothetical protein